MKLDIFKSIYNRFSPRKIEFISAAGTHVGKVRTNNEDRLRMATDKGLYIVCDGMGGHHAGEVASELAITVVEKCLQNGDTISQAIEAAHKQINTLDIDERVEKAHPGTTIVVLKIAGNRYQIGWVGDSRLWLMHNGKVEQVSVDHTVVQQMVNWGDITPEEALSHPDKNRLSQALGTGETQPRPGLLEGRVQKEMLFLLATDGMALWDEPEKLQEILTTHEPQPAVDTLIDLSLEAGGHDNVSCIIVRCR